MAATIPDYRDQWFNNCMAATNDDNQTNELSESNADVEIAAVNGVERSVPTLQSPVTPLDLRKSTQKWVPHQDRNDMNSTKAKNKQTVKQKRSCNQKRLH